MFVVPAKAQVWPENRKRLSAVLRRFATAEDPMAGLGPAIYVFCIPGGHKTWTRGSSPREAKIIRLTLKPISG
jgi:hypothetical protein